MEYNKEWMNDVIIHPNPVKNNQIGFLWLDLTDLSEYSCI